MNLKEADAWFLRNRDKLGLVDPVSDMIERLGLEPKNVLEIGCANGWRLEKLRQKYGCSVDGVEASPKACRDGLLTVANGHLIQGLFPHVGLSHDYDLIICGFFLYLAPREDLFEIVEKIDRHLEDGGWLIIHDFYSHLPHSRPYIHDDSLLCYKMDYSRLFTGNPTYMWWNDSGVDADGVTVMVLRKMRAAWPTL